MLGLRFCARALSSCGKWGPLFIAVRGPLTSAASPVAEHRLQTRRLSNCGSRAQLLHGMWDPPRPGLKPASPASAGRLSTTAPPGKPHCIFYTFCLDLEKALLAKEQSPKPWHVQKFFRSFTHFNASIYKIGVLCVQIWINTNLLQGSKFWKTNSGRKKRFWCGETIGYHSLKKLKFLRRDVQ